MTIAQILTKLGYQEAGVEYDNEILQDISDYFSIKGISVSDLSYRDNEYKNVGTLYKYFYIEKNGDSPIGLTPNLNDGEHYSNIFWKL